MIIGAGLLATKFSFIYNDRQDVCIYAAGVSNSKCDNLFEFSRERNRLLDALELWKNVDLFVYFGTCSIADKEVRHTQYVQHKLAMERLVATHRSHLILRLPQVAGNTTNPHTLLNSLYACIVTGQTFNVWKHAYRNVIDVDDVLTLSNLFIENKTVRQCAINLANPANYAILEIVSAMEKVVGLTAIFNVVNVGCQYEIDLTEMLTLLAKTNINFDNNYLENTLHKYYG